MMTGCGLVGDEEIHIGVVDKGHGKIEVSGLVAYEDV
jgi:hypothetical protein